VRSIRSFLNLDTPALAKIWHLHHQAYRSKSDCTVVAWDHAVLAKPFFRNEQLLIAEDSSEEIVGFAHWGKNPEAQRVGKGVGILHRLCVRPGEDEDAIASELIEASLQAMMLEGHERCVGI
jgi:predicted N-acetyltransferase YhbS